MISLVLIECKRCGSIYNGENEDFKIKPFEQIEIVWKRLGKCDYCPKGGRNTAKPGGTDFSSWDEDAWRENIK